MARRGRVSLTLDQKIERKQTEISELQEKKSNTVSSYDEKIKVLNDELDELVRQREEERWGKIRDAIVQSGKSEEEILQMLNK